jgi:hypothetical protein
MKLIIFSFLIVLSNSVFAFDSYNITTARGLGCSDLKLTGVNGKINKEKQELCYAIVPVIYETMLLASQPLVPFTPQDIGQLVKTSNEAAFSLDDLLKAPSLDFKKVSELKKALLSLSSGNLKQLEEILNGQSPGITSDDLLKKLDMSVILMHEIATNLNIAHFKGCVYTGILNNDTEVCR